MQNLDTPVDVEFTTLCEAPTEGDGSHVLIDRSHVLIDLMY